MTRLTISKKLYTFEDKQLDKEIENLYKIIEMLLKRIEALEAV